VLLSVVLKEVKGVVATIYVERAHNLVHLNLPNRPWILLRYVCISASELSSIAHAASISVR
jgi:hypothetical protein